MNKIFYTLLATLLMATTQVNAKEVKNPETMPQKVEMQAGKAMHKMNKWLEKETIDIEDDYREAVDAVERTTFSAEHKKVLKTQAQTNKDLALKQAKEVDAQLKKNWKERESFRSEMKEKKDRKACKEVDSIIK